MASNEIEVQQDAISVQSLLDLPSRFKANRGGQDTAPYRRLADEPNARRRGWAGTSPTPGRFP